MWNLLRGVLPAPRILRWFLDFWKVCEPLEDRDSSVGTATHYGLNGPGIESLWEAGFSAPTQTGPWVHQASYTMDTGSFQGVKRPGRGVDHHIHLALKLKSRAISLLPLWAFVAFSRVTFTFLWTPIINKILTRLIYFVTSNNLTIQDKSYH